MNIASGIFSDEDGLQLLELLDNALVQKKRRDRTFSIDKMYARFLQEMRLPDKSTQPPLLDDLLRSIHPTYRNLSKEDRFIVYMDSVRQFFFETACDLNVTTFKKPAPVPRERLPPVVIEPRSKRRQADAATVISETTEVASQFTTL